MRKTIYISLSLLLIVFITACDITKSKLECTSSGTGGSVKINQTYTIYFNKDNITSINISKSYTFVDKNAFKSFGTLIDNTSSSIKGMGKNYIKFDAREQGQKYITTLQVDMKSITSDELNTLGLSKKLSDLKQQLENQGLTCK